MFEFETAVLIVIFGILCVIAYGMGMDKRQERIMAERGYCYQSVDRMNNQPTWQYQKCK